jgi:hypothetical protein
MENGSFFYSQDNDGIPIYHGSGGTVDNQTSLNKTTIFIAEPILMHWGGFGMKIYTNQM